MAGSSYRRRALSAFALMIGLYALALLTGGGALTLAYIEVFVAPGGINLRVVIFALFIGGTVVWSVLPRPEPICRRHGASA